MTSAKIRNRRNSPRPAAETETANRSVLPCAGILRLIWLGRKSIFAVLRGGTRCWELGGRGVHALALHVPISLSCSAQSAAAARRSNNCRNTCTSSQLGCQELLWMGAVHWRVLRLPGWFPPFSSIGQIIMTLACWCASCQWRAPVCYRRRLRADSRHRASEGATRYPCVCERVFPARELHVPGSCCRYPAGETRPVVCVALRLIRRLGVASRARCRHSGIGPVCTELCRVAEG